MRRLTSLVCLSLALFASLALAADSSRNNSELVPADVGGVNNLYGGSLNTTKAAGDTVWIMGGPGTAPYSNATTIFQNPLLGKFQDTTGTLPQEQGWVGVDITQMTVSNWNISTFNCANLDLTVVPNHAMWAGQTFAAGCGGGDPAEGYANGYLEWLDWYGTVASPGLPTSVTVNAVLNNDSEPGYDTLGLAYESHASGTFITVGPLYSGLNVGVVFSQTFPVASTDYVGTAHDKVHLRWAALADGGWSDSDCLWPTSGHSQIDKLEVQFGGVRQAYDDFEGAKTRTGPLWTFAFPPGVGDFSKVWPRLGDVDICTSNNSPQFAFIDDGIVVPGTGGTLGLTWTYGPSGYTVNLLGGLAGPAYSLTNEVWSPELIWPAPSGTPLASYDGGRFTWNVYTHLPLTNGLFYQWQIRNSIDGGLTWGAWKSDNFVYYGGGIGQYGRPSITVNTYLTPSRNKVQVSLAALEVDFGIYFGTDATPAPYFDNVGLYAYKIAGPGITAREIDMFNDGWPTISEIDYVTLANNSVRIDMANNIAPRLNLMNDPGDSMVMTVAPVRSGSTMPNPPEMIFRMKKNPLYVGVTRTIPVGLVETATHIDGSVAALPIYINGVLQINRWCWDLPDENFFFPGDQFHYFIKAMDDLLGNVGTTTLPADTSGFMCFVGHPDYNSQQLDGLYKIDALPSMSGLSASAQPKILWWNDARDRANQNEWMTALDNLGWVQGATDGYDVYSTNGPSSGVGNGLGGRTNHLKMAGYNAMLYCSSNLGSYTLSNGDFNADPGNDISVMDSWLSLGGKSLFATGDNLMQDLSAGVTKVAFRDKWFSVSLAANDVRPLIGGQTAVTVAPITVVTVPPTPVFSIPFTLFGGCDGGINDFDAVTVTGTAKKIAEFCSPAGNRGAYPLYAAGVYNYVAASTTRITYVPYDLHYIYPLQTLGPIPFAGKKAVGVAVRANILQDILAFYGLAPAGLAVGVTPEVAFTARNYPNPFNPSTKIEFTLPRAGQVELKIYNVRGELVKTLLNENMVAATHSVIWDGRNSTGQSVSSGVYFYSLKAGSYEKMEKMTLVK